MREAAANTNTTLLSAGTILVHESVLLPKSLKVETSLYANNWRVITTDRQTLEHRIGIAGWNFFFTIGQLEASAFGSLTPPNLRRAVLGILRQVQDLHFNAVEIKGIRSRRTFGMIRSISVSANARHIQKSEQLDTDQQRKLAQAQSAWAIG